MPIRVDEQGRTTSYEAHEQLPKDYFGPGDPLMSDPEPEKLPVPEPAATPPAQEQTRRSTSRTTKPKPDARPQRGVEANDAKEMDLTPDPVDQPKPDAHPNTGIFEHHDNEHDRSSRVTTTTEAQGPVQQTRLTVGKPEESKDAESRGHTGGSGDSSHVPGHTT